MAKPIRRASKKECALYHSVGKPASLGEIVGFIFKLGSLVVLFSGIAMALGR